MPTIYHVDWRVSKTPVTDIYNWGVTKSHNTIQSRARHQSSIGLRLSVNDFPAITPVHAGAFAMTNIIDPGKIYALEGTFVKPTAPFKPKDAWAVVLVAKTGDETDKKAADKRLGMTFQFKKDSDGTTDAVFMNNIGLKNPQPPEVKFTGTDYDKLRDRLGRLAPASRFTLRFQFRLNHRRVPSPAGGTMWQGRARSTMMVDGVVKSRTADIVNPLRSSNYTAVGVALAISKFEPWSSFSVICEEFKVLELTQWNPAGSGR